MGVSATTAAGTVTVYGRQEGSLVQQNSVTTVGSNIWSLTPSGYFRHSIIWWKLTLVLINSSLHAQQSIYKSHWGTKSTKHRPHLVTPKLFVQSTKMASIDWLGKKKAYNKGLEEESGVVFTTQRVQRLADFCNRVWMENKCVFNTPGSPRVYLCAQKPPWLLQYRIIMCKRPKRARHVIQQWCQHLGSQSRRISAIKGLQKAVGSSWQLALWKLWCTIEFKGAPLCPPISGIQGFRWVGQMPVCALCSQGLPGIQLLSFQLATEPQTAYIAS